MKRLFSTFIVGMLILLSPGMAAPLGAGEKEQPRFRAGIYFEGFRMSDKNLTEFYGHSQRNLPGIEASVHTFHNIDIWMSYRIYRDKTATTFFAHPVKFRLNAASVGLVYRPVVWGRFEPFIGAGAEIYSYSERIEGESDLQGTSGNAAGYHVQTGTFIGITRFIESKIFIRYSGVKKSLAVALPDGTKSLDLGGLEFGIGILARF